MTTSSTPISLAGTASPVSVAQELGLGLTTQISFNDAVVRTLAAVGGSGTTISMSSLQAKTNRTVINILVNAGTSVTNYVANVAKISSGYIAGKTDVIFTINSGQNVGSSSTGSYAFIVDTSWNAADTVTIVNNGRIAGAGAGGGAGGVGVSGGKGANFANPGSGGGGGGPGINIQRATNITNNGTIAGGGGGGGGGGASGSVTGPPHNLSFTYYGNGGNGGSGAGTNTASYSQTGGAIGFTQKGPSYYGVGGSGGTPGSSGGGGTTGYGSSAGGGAGGGSGGQAVAGNTNITWNVFGTRLGGIA